MRGQLDLGCRVLSTGALSNRIAHGRFVAQGAPVTLAPNFPGSDHPHTIHGFGWLASWDVAHAGDAHARLTYMHHAGEWPWPLTRRRTLR
jgi:aldose 1-epimerase